MIYREGRVELGTLENPIFTGRIEWLESRFTRLITGDEGSFGYSSGQIGRGPNDRESEKSCGLAPSVCRENVDSSCLAPVDFCHPVLCGSTLGEISKPALRRAIQRRARWWTRRVAWRTRAWFNSRRVQLVYKLPVEPRECGEHRCTGNNVCRAPLTGHLSCTHRCTLLHVCKRGRTDGHTSSNRGIWAKHDLIVGVDESSRVYPSAVNREPILKGTWINELSFITRNPIGRTLCPQ